MSKKLKRNLIRIIISLVAFLIVFICDKVYGLERVSLVASAPWLFPLILYGAIYILIAYDIISRAFTNILHGQIFDENFLMGVATIGAFAIRAFDEAVAVILFYQVGEWFQSYAVGKSRRSISALMDIRPDFANIRVNGAIERVSPEEVAVGDIILIKPGEKVPLDGVVVSGSSSLDTKALTGESIPREVGVGSEVLSGSINLTTTIEIKVTKAFYDSTVSKILDLVENASSQKSKAENFITKFAKYYTPTVVVSALLLAIIPGLITGNWQEWIYRALNFLVVSCPCALVISIPMSFFAGIGIASKNNILVKGSNYLEKLSGANIFVFDKTGTLTKGNFVVTKIFPEDRKDEILQLAASCEKQSNHPIARSIINAYGKEVKDNYTLTDISGFGIKAESETGDVILCGNFKLMENNGIKCEKTSDVGTVVYIAKNGNYLGYMLINDEIKQESYDAISSLNESGARTVMLTGDSEEVAFDVAKKLGLSEYKASLLPQQKVEQVENLLGQKSEKDVLCFVGDGINDAPVLMRSDIGIAMGGIGSDATIEASDIVLMRDNIKDISVAKSIAKRTMAIVKQNIIFALGVKIAILVLSALGITNLWIAVFGDVGVAVLAILNAMRVMLFKKEK